MKTLTRIAAASAALGLTFALTSGLAASTPAAAQQGSSVNLTGEWTGNYFCLQGFTFLQLTITDTPGPGGVDALVAKFTFDVPPLGPAGSFEMAGQLTGGRKMKLSPSGAEELPPGYLPVSLDGFLVNNSELTGFVTGAPGCDGFFLSGFAATSLPEPPKLHSAPAESTKSPLPHEATTANRWQSQFPDANLKYVNQRHFDYLDAAGRRIELVGADEAYAADKFARLEASIRRHVITKDADVLVIDATAASPAQLQSILRIVTARGVKWGPGAIKILEPDGGLYG
jgi:hypothetical protein